MRWLLVVGLITCTSPCWAQDTTTECENKVYGQPQLGVVCRSHTNQQQQPAQPNFVDSYARGYALGRQMAAASPQGKTEQQLRDEASDAATQQQIEKTISEKVMAGDCEAVARMYLELHKPDLAVSVTNLCLTLHPKPPGTPSQSAAH